MNQPTILAVMCHKGGAGKTTTVAGLADAFAKMGKKVLIVDADEQSNIKTIFGIKLQSSEGGLAAVLLNNVNPNNLTAPVRPNIDVILSGGRLMRDLEKTHSQTPDAEFLMSKRMANIKGYDIIIIDTPPALSLISTNVVMYADYLLLPCSPELLAFVGLKNTISFVENIETHFKARNIDVAQVLGVIPTMHDGRRNLDMDILDDLERLEHAGLIMGGTIFTPIRNDIKVKTAQVKRKLLSEAFPTAKATEDYFTVADEILKRVDATKDSTTTTTSQAEATV